MSRPVYTRWENYTRVRGALPISHWEMPHIHVQSAAGFRVGVEDHNNLERGRFDRITSGLRLPSDTWL
jgi:hypothetical protein